MAIDSVDVGSQTTAADLDVKTKEDYFTASQGQLIWTRFKKNRSAMFGAYVLMTLILAGIFSSRMRQVQNSYR